MTGGVPEGAPPVVMLCCVVLLVAPLVFLAPEAPAAAWPALMGRAAVCAGGRRPAREIATRELRSEWSISRPALALPPPTGTAATSTPAGLAPPSTRAATHTTAAIPAGHASLFLWLLRLLLQHMTTAGNTPDEIGK